MYCLPSRTDLGDYENLAEVAKVADDAYKVIIDQTLSSNKKFPGGAEIPTITITFSTPTDGEDSYGINKVIVYGDTEADVTGWEVFYKSIPRDSEEMPCKFDKDGALYSYGSGKTKPLADATDKKNAEIYCGVNPQTKTLILKHAKSGDEITLKEVVIGGLQSSKYPCEKGWSPGSQPCRRCEEGTKGIEQAGASNDAATETLCEDCSPGQYSKFNNAYDPILTCIDCNPGHFSAEGVAACNPCETGWVQPLSGKSTCTKCSKGKYQDVEGKTTCKPCGPGQYSLDGAAACTVCPAGHFAKDEGSEECDKCLEGSAQPDKGQSSCSTCDKGYYADVLGTVTCSACPVGYFAEKSGTQTCAQCAAGKFQANDGGKTCDECSVGMYNAALGSAKCDKCAAGTFQNAVGKTTCTDCPKGEFQDALGQTACKKCSALWYQDTVGQSSCKQCPDGETSLPGAENCVACEAGTFSDVEGSKSCKPCEAGTYSLEKAMSCLPCEAMKYQDEPKQSTCKDCEAGTYTKSTGKTVCELCDRGEFIVSDMTECDKCAAGTYSDANGASDCTPCPKGTISGKGAIECTKCAKGKYQAEVGKDVCIDCPKGTYGNKEGLTECAPCKVDTVSNELGAFSCGACSYGFYSPKEGGTVCETCPKRAAYQPPSCPPIIPNCPALTISNQYGNFSYPEVEPNDDGTGTPKEQDCGFALYIDDEKVFGKFTSECKTWFESGEQKSNWGTPSYAVCGTVQTEKIYQQTVVAREAIKEAEAAGLSAAEATVDPAAAATMLTGLMSVIGTTEPVCEKDTNGDCIDCEKDDDGNCKKEIVDPNEPVQEEPQLGAADTANVVKTLSVVANSLSAEALSDPATQNGILGAIDGFASQDDDFVADTGTEAASAAVNVIESIGESILATSFDDTDETDNSGGGDNSAEPAKKKSKEIKTSTMTIVPTPLTEETKTKPIALDFGVDDEVEEEKKEEEKKKEEEEAVVDEKPKTDAPEVLAPAAAEESDEPAPTQAVELAIVAPTKPPPVKKIVKVEMPPLNNLIAASNAKEGEEAKGLLAVVFETPSLFPTNKTKKTTDGAAKEIKTEIASKVLLLSFGSDPITGIDPPVQFNFTKDDPDDFDPSTQAVNFKCVYYVKATQEWSSEGCETKAVDKSRGGQVACSCTHMTSFAILMSLEPIPDYLEEIQSKMTNPLLGFSLLCLFLMIFTILPFKQLRSTRSMKIHLSLAGSQCFAIIVFLLTNLNISSSAPFLCKAIAILMDYSYLVVFMWTVVESCIMYISLVQVFGGHISKYMLKFNLFAWSTPLLSPLTDYFLTEGTLLEDDKCVVNLEVRKWSFILPVGVVLVFNLFIFGSLLKVIAHAKNPDKSSTENTLKQLKAVASISCLLGIGWIIAFFAYGVVAPYVQFAFIIINGTQGMFMFLFYCIGNEQYMDLWKAKFGIEVNKKSNTASSTMQRTQTQSAAPAYKQAPVAAASPPPPPAAAATPKPKPTVPDTPVATKRVTRQSAKEETIYANEEALKDDKDTDSNIYDENVYDIIDDPDIRAKDPATITRI